MLVREILSEAFSTLVLDFLGCIDCCLSCFTCKGGVPKQSKIHLAILDVYNSSFDNDPLCIRRYCDFLTRTWPTRPGSTSQATCP